MLKMEILLVHAAAKKSASVNKSLNSGNNGGLSVRRTLAGESGDDDINAGLYR
jgi:hypothetical protein